MEALTAVILAGGLGTRLRTVVSDRPKVLAAVEGRPFLAYLFDQLVAFNVRHVVLCTGYLGEQIEATFGRRYQSLALNYSQESTPLGTGGALRAALSLCRSDPVLVMNGDSFCVADLRSFYAWYQEKQLTTGALLLTKVDHVERYGQVRLAAEGLIAEFNEKGRATGAGWINAGVYLLSQALLASIPHERAVSLENDMFPIWRAEGLYGFQGSGKFIDIGLPETYFSARDFFAVQ